jgi:hypothetical protein
MATEGSLTLDVISRLQIVGYFLEHLYVRLDAFSLDRAARRREVARRRQPQRAVARAERDDGLHRALAERTRADDRRTLVVLQHATMTGLPLVRSPGRALKRCVSSALRPRVETISPLSRNASETEIA